MKCKKCKDNIDSDTEYCGRCILESVQDLPIGKTAKSVQKQLRKRKNK